MSVRAYDHNGVIYFVGKDVVECIGYTKVAQCMEKVNTKHKCYAPECGLYLSKKTVMVTFDGIIEIFASSAKTAPLRGLCPLLKAIASPIPLNPSDVISPEPVDADYAEIADEIRMRTDSLLESLERMTDKFNP
jgi:hypothetical protein